MLSEDTSRSLSACNVIGLIASESHPGSDVLPWVLIRTGALASFSLGFCPPPLPARVSGPSSSCLPPAAGDEARQLVRGGALLPRTLSMGIHPWNKELVPWPQAAMWH